MPVISIGWLTIDPLLFITKKIESPTLKPSLDQSTDFTENQPFKPFTLTSIYKPSLSGLTVSSFQFTVSPNSIHAEYLPPT